MFRLIFLLMSGCLLASPAAHAQDQFGGHPPGLKWHILSSDAVRVIYPFGMETQATRVADVINHIDQNHRRSIGDKSRRFDLVLQNQTTIPNGYVSLSPLRSEFFATPPQSHLFTGSLDWMDILAVHEYRHVLQTLNARRGFTRFMYWLQGESGWALFSALSLPNWYWEGDAVVSETALTSGGRGRSPFFTREQRALAQAGKSYTYMKHRNGSLKDLMPDHYRLGYLMLTHVRNTVGNDISKDIMADAAGFKGVVYPFSRSMKRHTGLYAHKMFKEAWDTKKQAWEDQLAGIDLIATEPVTPKAKRTVTHYRYPRYLDDGSIVARKSSYKKTDALVHLKNGKEERLAWMGLDVDDYLSLGDGKLAWTEVARDPRFGNRVYSYIVLYDLESGKKRKLTRQSKYFSPAVAPDGQSLVAVHVSPDQQNQLHMLDLVSGDILQKVPNEANDMLSRPVWLEDAGAVVVIAKRKSRLTLLKIDLQSKALTQLLPWTAHTIEAPVIHDDRVYFNASYTGIDNLFYTDLKGSRQICQVSAVPIGAYEPSVSPSGDSIVFSEFTEMGFVISRQPLENRACREVVVTEPADMVLFQTVAQEVEGGDILDDLPNNTYETKRYGGLFRGLKLHSWHVSPSNVAPAAGIEMQNLFNDLIVSARAGININEDNRPFFDTAIRFGRWYPVLDLHARRLDRSVDYLGPPNSQYTHTFDETVLGGGVSLPFRWFHGRYQSGLTASAGLDYHISRRLFAGNRALPDRSFGSYNLALLAATLQNRARQNVGPRSGFQLSLFYAQGLSETDVAKGVIQGILHLPGLFPNHAIRFRAGYQKERLENTFQFQDTFEYSRGYSTPINDTFTLISLNYGMPLFYPDAGVPGLFYLKRVRINAFADMGEGTIDRDEATFDYRSWGIEVLFDQNVLNLIPLTVGLRQSFLLDEDPRLPETRNPFNVFVSLGM